MVAGVIIMILFTYVISVFVIHEIEKENSIIGTLYALGVTKKQLLKYYLTVPVTVTFLAGLAGMIIGYSPIGIPITATDRDFFFLRRRDPAAAVKTIQELCQTRLPKNMGIQPSDIQVLSPSRKHETGTKALNLALQAVLNPPAEGKKEKKHGDFSFRTGDRVMQIRNNYDIMWKRADGLGAGTGIFNGDIGTVTDIDFQEETMTIQFDDRTA